VNEEQTWFDSLTGTISKLSLRTAEYAKTDMNKQTKGKGPVFPPAHAIVGIQRCNQRWPPEKQRKGQFGPFLLQDYRLNQA